MQMVSHVNILIGTTMGPTVDRSCILSAPVMPCSGFAFAYCWLHSWNVVTYLHCSPYSLRLSAQYGQPDAQQWAQYAAQPQQQYAEQQPDYSYYYQQQAQPQGVSQPYQPQATL